MDYLRTYTKNAEGYADPTAAAALLHIAREQRAKEEAEKARAREAYLRRIKDKMTQRQFYKTQAWRRTRDAYIQRRIAIDGGICEVCGRELGKVVHHKIWLNDQNVNDIRVSLNPDNLRYECQTCHNAEENPETGSRWKDGQGPQRKGRRVIVNADGTLRNAGEY